MKKLLGAAVFPTCSDCAALKCFHRFILFNHLNVLIYWSCHLLAFFLSTLRCTPDPFNCLFQDFCQNFFRPDLPLFSSYNVVIFLLRFCTHKSWVFQFLSKSKLATILIDVTGSWQRYMQLRFRTPSVRNFFHKRQFSLP